jgi:hypothetical protein
MLKKREIPSEITKRYSDTLTSTFCNSNKACITIISGWAIN